MSWRTDQLEGLLFCGGSVHCPASPVCTLPHMMEAVESSELHMLSTVKYNGDTRLLLANATVIKIKRSRRRRLQRRLPKNSAPWVR